MNRISLHLSVHFALLLNLILSACLLSFIPITQSVFADSIDSSAAFKKFRPNIVKAELPPVTLNSDKEVLFDLTVTIPDGYHLNPGAPSDIVVRADKNILASDRVKELTTKLPFSIPKGSDQQVLTVETSLYYCKEQGASLCLIKSFAYEVPVQISSDGGTSNLAVSVKLPESL